MLTFNLKKEWFEKIKSGEKTHEYREVKDYWWKRIWRKDKFGRLNRQDDIEFVCGYATKNDKSKRLKAVLKNISIVNGLDTDLKIDKPVYDIKFELIKEQEDAR